MSSVTCPHCKEKISASERNCHFCGGLLSKLDTSYKKQIIIDRVPAIEKKKRVLSPYKVCNNCQTTNKQSAIVCRQCNIILGSAKTIENDDSLVTRVMKKQSTQDKISTVKSIIYFSVVFIIITSLLFVDFEPIRIAIYLYSLLLLFFGVLARFYPDTLFKLNFYQFFIKDPEPTEWYYAVTKFQSYIVPILAILTMIIK